MFKKLPSKMDTAESGGAAGGSGESVTETDQGASPANSMPAGDTISSVSDLSETHAVVYDGFDPAIHAVDAEGNPKKKPDGTYAKKRGRKAGTANQPPSSVAGSALPPKPARTSANAPSTDSAGLSSEAAARQMTNAFIGVGVMIFGEDWAPEDKAEPQELKNSLKDYFDAEGVVNIPPWFGVVLSFGAYSAKRLMKPTIMEKIGFFVSKIKRITFGVVL